jgi:hypothetical protein
MRKAGVLALVLLVEGEVRGKESMGDAFVEALRAEGPVPERARRMGLYEPLLGSWDVDVVDYEADGSRRTARGEWHFAWVLEGRAIQDVWICPRRSERDARTPLAGNRYGTTLRVYDPERDVWHVTWINPVSGVRNMLVGRREGDAIVQEGVDDDGTRIRWTFDRITRDAFHWKGEASADAGKTWRLDVEFHGRRARPAPAAGR